jgi:hypothetical protein
MKALGISFDVSNILSFWLRKNELCSEASEELSAFPRSPLREVFCVGFVLPLHCCNSYEMLLVMGLIL